ncbi:MAG: efflux RND transporter periplasmic adaptor subunit [Planctomycetota bacterium]|nr:efflux RND transporter periplasmic adaptor subunit [Planctomycetota bacterium]
MSEDPYIIVGTNTARRLVQPSKRKWLLPIVGGSLLLTAVIIIVATTLTSGGLPTVPVEKGTITWSFVASGRVETEMTIEIIPKISATIEAVHVQEGEEVQKGDLLITLRDDTIAARYQEAIQAKETAQARWEKIKSGTRKELINQGHAQWKEAEAELRRRKAVRDKIYIGATPEEKEQVEAKLSQAKAQLQYAQDEWTRIQKLKRDQVVTQREIDLSRRTLDTAKAQVVEATASRNRVTRGATKEEKEEADAAVAIAEAKVEQAEANLNRLKKGATEEEKKVAQAEVKAMDVTIERLKVELAQLRIHAPISGYILRRYKDPGELTFPQMKDPIVVISEKGEKKFRIELLEQDIYKVAENQELEVISDSYPGRTWKATVERISPVLGKKRLSSESPKQKYDVKVLEIWLSPTAPIDLPINLPVEARMNKVVRENVLVLPARAVDPSGYVYVNRNERIKVETGKRDDAFIEILSGLQEGDAVWIP